MFMTAQSEKRLLSPCAAKNSKEPNVDAEVKLSRYVVTNDSLEPKS